jgi:hypothetical protein
VRSGRRLLRAGEWSLALAPDGSVTNLAYRGDVVLAGVAVVVRDDEWGTVPAEADVIVDDASDTVVVNVSARHRGPDAAFVREDELRLERDGFSLRTRGTAVGGAVVTNRIGIVLLHPLRLAGGPVRVIHGDGRVDDTVFPVEVAPQQPFLDVHGLEHSTPEKSSAVRIELDGDTFETEDQRNWSDASFKTYSRPLAFPSPYRIEEGATIEQSVRVVAAGSRVPVVRDRKPQAPVAPSRPRVGVCLGPDDDPVVAGTWAARLGIHHVRVDVATSPRGMRGLDRLRALAEVGVPIELAVHVGEDPAAALDELAASLDALTPGIDAVAVFDAVGPATTRRAWDAVRAAVGDRLRAPLLVGTDDHFAELNRNRPDPAWGADGVTFSLTPQVHADDDESVLGCVASFDAILRTARRLSPTVAVGALTLRPRRNIHRSGVLDRLARDPSSSDPRQFGEFAADWLTASLDALRRAGVARVTALEFTGPRGLVDPATTSLAPVGRALAAFLQEAP